MEPSAAVVLGLDPGESSGVALVVKGKVIESGVCSQASKRRWWVERAVQRAEVLDLPLVCAMETWTAHGRWGFKQALSLGAQAGRWLQELENVRVDVVVRVEPAEWRREVFGVVVNKKKEVWKGMAKAYAAGLVKDPSMREDQAEAICIALWGSRSRRVADELRKALKRNRRTHG